MSADGLGDFNAEQLAQAIALSLEAQFYQPPPPDEPSHHLEVDATDVIDLSSESDDDLDIKIVRQSRLSRRPLSKSSVADPTLSASPDVQRQQNKALGTAKEDKHPKMANTSPHSISRLDDPVLSSQGHLAASDFSSGPISQGLSLAGMDRKRMEQDRLKRLKRKALTSPTVSPPPSRRSHPEQHEAIASNHSSFTTPTADVQQNSRAGLQYPKGTVRKTWAFGFAREQDIKIEEVLQKGDLHTAVLSAFQWDVDWLLRKLDLTKTKMIFVMQAKYEGTKAQYRAETASMANLRLCFPPMSGNVNCMHSKLQLLFHSDYLRLVVPSANLVPYDWGENGGIMENTVFIVDLPRLPKEAPSQPDTECLTLFGRELIYFLKAMGLSRDVIEGVMRFDFSATDELAFVHSIGGSHSEERWRRTGYCGLGRAVKALGLQQDGPMEVDFVSSSIGSLNEQFLKTIYLAAKGDDGLTEYQWRTSGQAQPRRRNKAAVEDASDPLEAELVAKMKTSFRIYFPTLETVASSRGGTAAGGTICLQSRWFDAPEFPRDQFRDCRSQRPGMLMHNKLLFAHSGSGRAWAYIGSANLSESAWGRLVKDKSTKLPKLNCRNWECGVVVPMPSSSQAGMGVFARRVPVPMRMPGVAYASRRPWFFTG